MEGGANKWKIDDGAGFGCDENGSRGKGTFYFSDSNIFLGIMFLKILLSGILFSLKMFDTCF